MQIKFKNGKIGVQKLGRQTKKSTSFDLIADVESEEFLGIVRFMADDLVQSESTNPIKVGDKVYFGNILQTVHMKGAAICVMEFSNILAVVREEESEATK